MINSKNAPTHKSPCSNLVFPLWKPCSVVFTTYLVILFLTTLMSIRQGPLSLINFDSDLIRPYCPDLHRPFVNHLVIHVYVHHYDSTKLNRRQFLNCPNCLSGRLSDRLLSQLSRMSIGLSGVGRTVAKQVCLSVSQVLVGRLNHS